MKKSTYLFVDGSNLYGAQFALFGPKSYLDFSEFVSKIELLIGEKFNKIYFYASYSPKSLKPTKKEAAYLKNEGLFYKSVKNTSNTIFFKGYRSKTSGKEKEVDVKIAVDIVDFAHRNKYHAMYLLSGDADFLHALFTANTLKKQIRLLCVNNHILFKAMYYFPTYIVKFGDRVSMGSTDKSPIRIMLKESELVRSI